MPRKMWAARCSCCASQIRFNGAEAVMPRKIWLGLRLSKRFNSFNGAEAVMPRKIRSPSRRSGSICRLQWGRGSDASEDQP